MSEPNKDITEDSQEATEDNGLENFIVGILTGHKNLGVATLLVINEFI